MYNSKYEPMSWTQFVVCNQDSRTAFENMCRSLFRRQYLDEFCVPHSNPNNPGIEIEPIMGRQNKRISFQCKFFSDRIDYNQIEDSAKKTVKYYSGKLDIVYLYCNKDINTDLKNYKNLVSLLGQASIELVPVTGQTILDMISDYPSLASLYFHKHNLNRQWFEEQLRISLDSLGSRYNANFNIETTTEHHIDLFSKNSLAAQRINQKKLDAITEIKYHYSEIDKYDRTLADNLIRFFESIADIDTNTILNAVNWGEMVRTEFSEVISKIELEIRTAENELENLSIANDETAYHEKQKEINILYQLLEYFSLISLDEVEKRLLKSNVVFVRGDAGVGKTQLFASCAKKAIDSGGYSLLLLGQSFLSSDPLLQQIVEQLNLPFDMDEFLNILEGIGERENKTIVVFIDAINESANKNVWKSGLPSLINKFSSSYHLKLAISVRDGYDVLVIDESTSKRIKDHAIAEVIHSGFEGEPLEVIQTFLNYYQIPFSPSYYLQQEMTNPLFLSLFCQVATKENVNIFELFRRIVQKADKEAQLSIGYDGSAKLLPYLIDEIADHRLEKDTGSILKADLLNFQFWDTYGLNNNKIKFLMALERFGILNSYVNDGQEYYYFAYNLMEDFLCARRIMARFSSREEVTNYIKKSLLVIIDNQVHNYSNRGIFAVLCGLYAERYGEECIDIVDSLPEGYEKSHLVEAYMQSFLWRNNSSIDSSLFLDYANSHYAARKVFWNILLESALKLNHPLNAEFLHQILLNKPISHRDFIWTSYINHLTVDESRIVQLILHFDKGNTIEEYDNYAIWLLLVLLSWFLTSSNRFLRDKCSKSMIEILKQHFEMCKPLLEKFEKVNDPYVIQRLYGVVFGACTKRKNRCETEYKKLTHYVIERIFNQDMVFPDILLRDYARLIVEQYVFEFPGDNTVDISKARPPYRSLPIPIVEKQSYYQKKSLYSGFSSIDFSLHPDQIEGEIGVYGDFGRYVFQAALTDFDGIDLSNLYHFAMQFIRDQLGYTNELLGEYDISYYVSNHSRHDTHKIERIGKKYEWIAFYHILARISDRHLLKAWNAPPYLYEGAWNPYVRDFDPTLNCNCMNPPDLPQFFFQKHEIEQEFLSDSPNEAAIETWKRTPGKFFSNFSSKLIISDSTNTIWVFLHQNSKIQNRGNLFEPRGLEVINGAQEIWSQTHGYLVHQEDFENFQKEFDATDIWNVINTYRASEVYQLFNREYAWSPGYSSIFSSEWTDYEIEIPEEDTTAANTAVADEPLVLLGDLMDCGEDIDIITQVNEDDQFKFEEPEKHTIGKIMPAYSCFLWEEQYDASQEDTTSFDIPCKAILDTLHLKQREYDGYFYDDDGVLVAFDGKIADACDGLVIRKDYLERFLQKQKLCLLLFGIGEKQYFQSNHQQIWSEWEGVFYLKDDEIKGEMKLK